MNLEVKIEALIDLTHKSPSIPTYTHCIRHPFHSNKSNLHGPKKSKLPRHYRQNVKQTKPAQERDDEEVTIRRKWRNFSLYFELAFVVVAVSSKSVGTVLEVGVVKQAAHGSLILQRWFWNFTAGLRQIKRNINQNHSARKTFQPALSFHVLAEKSLTTKTVLIAISPAATMSVEESNSKETRDAKSKEVRKDWSFKMHSKCIRN